MSLSKEKFNELFDYLHALRGWAIKNHDALIVEWIDENNMINWCDNYSWDDTYTKRCYRDTKIAHDVLKILGWDVKTIKFIK